MWHGLCFMRSFTEGGKHSITGASEPDLELTDDENLIRQSNGAE